MDQTDTKENLNTSNAEEFEILAQKALRERPTISIRMRLLISFLLFFTLISGFIISTIVILHKLETKTQFLVIADKYTNEIQQARRFEKNFFLYSTNLDDLLEHTRKAQELMRSSRAELKSVLGSENLNKMTEHLDEYLRLLRELQQTENAHPDSLSFELSTIETKLREHGSLMVSFALDLSEHERTNIRNMYHWTKRVPLIFLFLLLVFAIYEANFLSRQIIGRLSRLMDQTKRIAEGDFTPIMPERKYRDEFSNVNIALTSMMHELDRHQKTMIQSHKLQAVGTLTAGVAHELNNPINNITLTAAMLEEDYHELSDEERAEMVGDLVKEADRASSIVRNLLNFARESEITSELLNIKELLKETLKLASNQIKLKKVKIEQHFEEQIALTYGDRQQLNQVFLNLILNALDAMSDGGKLQISLTRSVTPGFWSVYFEDNGGGIPPHVMQHIFDPFFTTKPTGKGTGLGLSVSIGIAKQHGGDILVDNINGKGAKFSVLLPITQMPVDFRANNLEES